MTLIRGLIAALAVAVIALATPAVATAGGGVLAAPSDICDHLPWWPGCP